MSAPVSIEQRAAIWAVLRGDLPVFAERLLKIKTKAGGNPMPLKFNDAQNFLHQAIQVQLANKGRARTIVLKGRQQGVSTYSQARMYWQLSNWKGRKGYTLAHEQKATDNLFGMVDLFWRQAPDGLKPNLGAANAKEMVFAGLDSRYEAATAGSKDTGRSGTAQFMHGSELGFWQHAEDHLAGLGQVVPDEPGTEILLESTANGTANVFHELWMLASKGKSDYTPVFIPWFWQAEYQRPTPADFELTDEEEDYRAAYGLTLGQMAWRRSKIATDFRGDVSLFDQEYPASAQLAFASSSPRALIKGTTVAKARAARGVEAVGPIVWGLDPAEYGDDSSSLMSRQGRVARKKGSWHGIGTMELVGEVGVVYDKTPPAERPAAIYVDVTGIGTGVCDRLKEQGYPTVRVHFGEGARDKEKYGIMRDEMWGEMSEWLLDSPASIEDSDDLAAQLTSVQYGYDSKRRLKMEAKEAMKKRGLRSPDDADALALTFARGALASHSDALAYRKAMGFST